MKQTFTIAAALCLFEFCAKGQTLHLKSDTSFVSPRTKDQPFVKFPTYIASRPEPIQLPNGYSQTSDKSIPIPTRKLDTVSHRVIPPIRIRK